MHKIWTTFSSLRLTIILLACAMVLIFFGTLDQVDYGIYEVQRRYFASFFTTWHYPAQWPGSKFLSWIVLPLPGGYLLTSLLVINLIAAHFKYFVFKWSKIGIVLIHLGILMLIISGVISSLLQEESQMILTQDKAVTYSQIARENELVIIDTTDPNLSQTHTISEKTLRSSSIIPIFNTPLSIKLEKFYPNSDIGLRSQNPEGKEKSLATQGAGAKMDIVVFPKPVSYKDNEVNGATAYVTVLGRESETESLDDIGTWLVSTIIDERFPSQKFSFENKSYEIALRPKRIYFPFSLKLLKFNHDLYPGTEIPRNFSSLVEIINPQKAANRTVLIYMNNPLRYEGYTFYQASYEGEHSILQVVKNPGWLLPYFSVLLVALGLTFHFFLYLFKYLTKSHKQSSVPQN